MSAATLSVEFQIHPSHGKINPYQICEQIVHAGYSLDEDEVETIENVIGVLNKGGDVTDAITVRVTEQNVILLLKGTKSVADQLASICAIKKELVERIFASINADVVLEIPINIRSEEKDEPPNIDSTDDIDDDVGDDAFVNEVRLRSEKYSTCYL